MAAFFWWLLQLRPYFATRTQSYTWAPTGWPAPKTVKTPWWCLRPLQRLAADAWLAGRVPTAAAPTAATTSTAVRASASCLVGVRASAAAAVIAARRPPLHLPRGPHLLPLPLRLLLLQLLLPMLLLLRLLLPLL